MATFELPQAHLGSWVDGDALDQAELSKRVARKCCILKIAGEVDDYGEWIVLVDHLGNELASININYWRECGWN